MMTVLEQTDASGISAALVAARKAAGSPAMGMVMTMVVVVPAAGAERAIEAAQEAAREHPSRVLAVVIGSSRGSSRVDAEVRSGSGTPGETALIRLSGQVAKHPESVVLPLLLPDSPVVVWWPTEAPADPAADPIGQLGTRRITDAAEVPTGRTRAMLTQCESYAPGNTDLAWTRITPWRALLAAALDQVPWKVTGVRVTAERVSPSAELLGAWLADRLKVPVTWGRSDGPGITEVALATRGGEIRLVRDDGRHATLLVPGQPDRPVGLRRRDVPELLHEELRRLDPDDIYAATVRRLSKLRGTKRPSAAKPTGKTTTKRTTKRTTASSTADRTAKKAAATKGG
jgi:glucose-6-phosphate dehydrogenase assembly protein OpcA